MLVAALYNLGKTEEIKAFIGDKIREYLKQLQIAVARGGIEPPTHGFSVRFHSIILNAIQYN